MNSEKALTALDKYKILTESTVLDTRDGSLEKLHAVVVGPRNLTSFLKNFHDWSRNNAMMIAANQHESFTVYFFVKPIAAGMDKYISLEDFEAHCRLQ